MRFENISFLFGQETLNWLHEKATNNEFFT